METLWQDLGYGFRMLYKNPRFTVVAVLSLAIGIGVCCPAPGVRSHCSGCELFSSAAGVESGSDGRTAE